MTTSTSFRLTDEALEKLRAIADANGISQTAVLELLIRQWSTRSSQNISPSMVDTSLTPLEKTVLAELERDRDAKKW